MTSRCRVCDRRLFGEDVRRGVCYPEPDGYCQGYDNGVEETVRVFWIAVCDQEVRHHERVAASERRLNRMLGVNTCRAADEHEALAAQYRAWAREGG